MPSVWSTAVTRRYPPTAQTSSPGPHTEAETETCKQGQRAIHRRLGTARSGQKESFCIRRDATTFPPSLLQRGQPRGSLDVTRE